MQESNATKDEERTNAINSLKKDFAIDNALRDAKAKNIIAVKALLKLEELELQDDGSIKGLSEQLDELVGNDDTKFLFDEEPKQSFKGAVPGESGDTIPSGNVDLSKMTYDERNAYLEEHPEIEV